MLWGAISLFWLAFLTDGVFSLTDALLAGESPALNNLRNSVAFLVLVASVPMAVLLGVTRRASKRVLIPLILFAWWAGPAMAFPLARWKVPHLALALAIVQVSLGVLVWLAFRQDFSRRESQENEPPAFSWKYLLFAGPLAGLFFLVLVGTSTLLGLVTHVELLTGGYVRVQPDGVYSLERKFQSGDREVRLTGMMHIASREFYSGLLSGVDSRNSIDRACGRGHRP